MVFYNPPQCLADFNRSDQKIYAQFKPRTKDNLGVLVGCNVDKGLKTKHPSSIEESNSKENTMIVVETNLDKQKIFVLGNPPAIEAHWFNIFVKQCEKDKDWFVKHMTWEGIVPFLNDYDVKEILKCKYREPEFYQYMYEGIPTGGLGRVYPMFRNDIHLIDYTNRGAYPFLQDYRIVGVIIGCDGAVTRSTIRARFIMSNGQSVAGKIF